MSSLSTLPKGDSAWLLRKAVERVMQQVSVLETNIGSSTTGNSANTQIIFNDAGTLRGDAGLTYNAATDTLSAGSATITGDLTVRTTGLVVGSTATGIGIIPNTWSAAWKAAQVGRLTLGNATTDSLIGHNFYNDGSYRFAANDFASYYDQVGGAHIWGSSVTSGTVGNAIGWTVLATLNSTGLGVGVSPANDKLLVLNSIGINTSTNGDLSFRNIVGTAQQRIRYSDTDGSLTIGSAQAVSYAIYFGGNTTTRAMTLDASGNLLLGTVTSPTGTKIGSIAKLGGVSAEGTNYISVSTTPVALSRSIGTGALFFVAGYNTAGGAQGWWLVASTGGAAPTVIASGNSTGLTVAFTTVAGVLNMNTVSGTLSVTAFAITN